jgi:hypothetical protein
MAGKMEIPAFASEAEEAQWWPEQEDRIAQEFESAGADGVLGRGSAVRRARALADAVLPDPEDVELARVQAESRGLSYQVYLKALLHDALRARQTSAR